MVSILMCSSAMAGMYNKYTFRKTKLRDPEINLLPTLYPPLDHDRSR